MTFIRKVLHPSFVKQYAQRPPAWGFGPLSELTFARTYSRELPDGSKEKWHQVIERVVNGVFQLKHEHLVEHRLPVNWEKDSTDAKDMYERMFAFKFLPGGRSLWANGTTLTTHPDKHKRLAAALNNCAFVSTENIAEELWKPFTFAFDALCLGVGVGFDTRGAGKIMIHTPSTDTRVHIIQDSREGFTESLQVLMESYFVPNKRRVEFDYSEIRPAGQKIKTFGGVSSGDGPLRQLHNNLFAILDKNAGSPITLTTIADISNSMGICVVSGNIRRSAELLLGGENEEFLSLKDWNSRPERNAWSWASNNSVVYEHGKTDLRKIAEKILLNGEPGLVSLENMQRFGRMNGVEDRSDYRVKGANPCVEMTLESYELCNLAECFPHHHETLEDFKRTQELALQFAKYVSLAPTHWPETNRVMLRNRRLGVSMSGIAQFIESRSLAEFAKWCDESYVHLKQVDKAISEELCVRESIKITTIKPSGTTSLLAGASAGLHYSQGKYYVRRVRLAKNSPLVGMLQRSGIHIEDSVTDQASVVASFPISSAENRFVRDVSMWEQLSLAALIQEKYSDNSVSATVTFDAKKETVESITAALEYFMPRLKCISMLPLLDDDQTCYPQMPLQTITEEEYQILIAKARTLDLEEYYRGDRVNRADDCKACKLGPYTLQRDSELNSKTNSNSNSKPLFIDEVDTLTDDKGFLQVPSSEQFCDSGKCQVR